MQQAQALTLYIIHGISLVGEVINNKYVSLCVTLCDSVRLCVTGCSIWTRTN